MFILLITFEEELWVSLRSCIFIVSVTAKYKNGIVTNTEKVLLHSRSCWTQQQLWTLKSWDVPELGCTDSTNSTSCEYLHCVITQLHIIYTIPSLPPLGCTGGVCMLNHSFCLGLYSKWAGRGIMGGKNGWCVDSGVLLWKVGSTLLSAAAEFMRTARQEFTGGC